MGAFWAGTVPVMLGLGLSLQLLSAPLRRRLPAVTAAMLIVVGLLWLFGRITPPSADARLHETHAMPAVQQTDPGLQPPPPVGDGSAHAGH
jgi:sulfite exporter TauE/SafE